MIYTDNPVRDFDRYDREQERKLEKLLQCEDPKCGKHIQDDYYFEIDGEILCEKCMIRRYRRDNTIE